MLELKSHYFDERHSHGVLLDVLLNGVTHSQNELVGHHEDQDVGSFHRLRQVWNGYLTEREMRYGEAHGSSSQQTVHGGWCVRRLVLTTLGGSL